MKATALAFLVVGVLVGCGQGTAGVRGDEPEPGSGGSDAMSSGGSVAPPASAGSAGSVSTAGGATGGGGSPGSGGSVGPSLPCGPDWVAGSTYAPGAVVLFQGSYYIAEHENPGYDPTISTYFWEPFACESDNGGGATGGSSAGGSGPVGDSSFDDIVSESQFQQMFPGRNAFYTYQGLVEATRKYSAFAGTGTTEERKREAAAFLANVARETGELVYIEQIEKDVYCSPSDKCPCQPGKQYYGRGPIQISWNYNYCSAGTELGYDLVTQPELVAQNPTIAWATGLWFWMTQRGAGNFTPHQGITEGHGFGETIRSINGGQECNGAWAEAVVSRVGFYERFCELLGATPGDNLHC